MKSLCVRSVRCAGALLHPTHYPLSFSFATSFVWHRRHHATGKSQKESSLLRFSSSTPDPIGNEDNLSALITPLNHRSCPISTLTLRNAIFGLVYPSSLCIRIHWRSPRQGMASEVSSDTPVPYTKQSTTSLSVEPAAQVKQHPTKCHQSAIPQ
jgi:hypothetical protein